MSIEKLSCFISVEFNGRLNGIQIGSISSWRKRSAKACKFRDDALALCLFILVLCFFISNRINVWQTCA